MSGGSASPTSPWSTHAIVPFSPRIPCTEFNSSTSGLLEALVTRAQQSPRLRSNHNFHRDAADNPHRFLNALARGTYCCPHRHLDPPKAESFVALTGEVAVFLFDDSGKVSEHTCSVAMACSGSTSPGSLARHRRAERHRGLLRGEARSLSGRERQAVRGFRRLPREIRAPLRTSRSCSRTCRA